MGCPRLIPIHVDTGHINDHEWPEFGYYPLSGLAPMLMSRHVWSARAVNSCLFVRVPPLTVWSAGRILTD